MAYVAYRIWLYMNSLVFDTEIVSAHQVLERALSLATKYYHFDIANSFVDTLGLLYCVCSDPEGTFHLLGAPTIWICKCQL